MPTEAEDRPRRLRVSQEEEDIIREIRARREQEVPKEDPNPPAETVVHDPAPVPEPDPEPEARNTDTPKQVMVWEPEAQASFDQALLNEQIVGLRKTLAATKLNVALAGLGMLGGDKDPTDYLRDAQRQTKMLGYLCGIRAELVDQALPLPVLDGGGDEAVG